MRSWNNTNSRLKISTLVFLIFTIAQGFACTRDAANSQDPLSEDTRGFQKDEGADGETSARAKKEINFFRRLNKETSIFTAEDETYLVSLPANPGRGSTTEAAIAIGIIKLVLRVNQNERAEILTDDQGQARLSGEQVSLEALSLEKSLILPEAIHENRYLKDLQFFKLCLQALKQSSNSESFTAAVNTAIAEELKNLNQVAGTQSENNANEIQEQVDTNHWQNAELSAADIRIGDNILVEAQTLADNRRYVEAITKANQIQNDCPLYQSAQERVIEFSDRAVQDLRQKAAQAFQNSIPVSDPRTRVAYLVKAKAHLEQALQEFPKAPEDQLTTVRENLAVISRDLEKLEGSE